MTYRLPMQKQRGDTSIKAPSVAYKNKGEKDLDDKRDSTLQAMQLQRMMQSNAAHNKAHTLHRLIRQQHAPQVQKKSNGVIQREPKDVAVTGLTHLVSLKNGSLYSKDYTANETHQIGEGDYVEIDSASLLYSRRGPNQEEFVGVDEDGPQHYGWYVVNRLNGKPVKPGTYIREDTFENLTEEDDAKLPIRSSIFGLERAAKETVHKAYGEGFRDFDGAFMYQKGKLAALFDGLTVDKGSLRLIYKFKFEEFNDAEAELIELSKIKGLFIHTIMLHDIPAGVDRRIALNALKYLSTRFNTKTGLSNVIEEDIESEDNLRAVLEAATLAGLDITSVQNRMSPAAPDKKVREVCKEFGIPYMAFGLKGGEEGGHKGTCEMGADTAVESFPLDTDPLLLNEAKKYGIKPEDLRHLMLDWARQQGLSSISQSRTSEGMSLMRSSFPSELLAFLELYAHGNEHYPHSISDAPMYQPFEIYLTELGISQSLMQPLLDAIPTPLWRLYYKHVLAREKENNALVRVMGKATSDDVENLIALAHYDKVSSVTDLLNLFEIYIQGARAGYKDEIDNAYPDTRTGEQLFAMHDTLNSEGKKQYLCDEEFDTQTLTELNDAAADKIVAFMVGSEFIVRYKKINNDQWVKQ